MILLSDGLSPNSRHSTVFRPRTNLPFERGAKYSSDDFVSELKKSFVRPTDDDMARSKPPLARQKSAITLEGPRGDFRTHKYADNAQRNENDGSTRFDHEM